MLAGMALLWRWRERRAGRPGQPSASSHPTAPEPGYSVFDLSERLHTRGWQVPAYTFPENLTDTAVMRVVVRNGFTRDLADEFLSDLDHHWRMLAAHPGGNAPLVPEGKRQGFAH
jgi:glutamate decarboxylase